MSPPASANWLGMMENVTSEQMTATCCVRQRRQDLNCRTLGIRREHLTPAIVSGGAMRCGSLVRAHSREAGGGFFRWHFYHSQFTHT